MSANDDQDFIELEPAGEHPLAGAPGDFSERNFQGVRVVTLRRPELLDGAAISELTERLEAYVQKLDDARVVLELQHVEHMSSAAIGMIIAVHKKCVERGGSLAVANARDDLKRVFKLARLSKLLPIKDDTEKAVDAIR